MNAETKIEAEPLAKLREPFPERLISKLPKPTKRQTEDVKADFKKGIRCQICGAWHHPDAVHLDYVGHAALTDRLLDTDPRWHWEPVGFTPEGLPALDSNGGLWIKLTVCGATRYGYGAADGKSGGDAVKEMIGDALRNAAMRFGAALDLWHKGDLHAAPHDPETGEIIETQPAREKVPGIAAIKQRLNAMMTEGNAITDAYAFSALVKANKDDLKTIRDAGHDYWTGDGGDSEGFEAWIARRREELTPTQESVSFQLLMSTLAEVETTAELQGWLKQHGDVVETLDGEEARRFESAYIDKEVSLIEKRTQTVLEAG